MASEFGRTTDGAAWRTTPSHRGETREGVDARQGRGGTAKESDTALTNIERNPWSLIAHRPASSVPLAIRACGSCVRGIAAIATYAVLLRGLASSPRASPPTP